MRRRYRSSSGEVFIWFAVFVAILLMKHQPNLNVRHIFTRWVYPVLGALFALLIVRIVVARVLKWRKNQKYIGSGIAIVDTMKGTEFERFLLAHFTKLGYHGRLTKTSNDYGADLILEKDHVITVVQAKRYRSKVGIKAIQELVASLPLYHATRGIVITNNYFTKSAAGLAEANNIVLWDRPQLMEIMFHNGSKEQAENTVTATLDSKVCPVCGGDLILKYGKYGSFQGCSSYPKCHFTRKCHEQKDVLS